MLADYVHFKKWNKNRKFCAEIDTHVQAMKFELCTLIDLVYELYLIEN